jgi:diguanylate cyclase (GGDEF)-like protein/PAS domain S-box-containing protein
LKDYDFNFKDIVASAKDVIIVTKAFPINAPGPEIVYVNKAFTDLTGYTAEEAIGKNPRMLQNKNSDKNTTRIIREGLMTKTPVRVAIENTTKAGESYWLDLSIIPLTASDGVVTHFVAIQRDITNQKDIERQLEILSTTDPLTGLNNTRSFNDLLKNDFSLYQRTSSKYSILMLDIDNFKTINDTYGHAIGDRALQTVSSTCQSMLRLHDHAARMGGDELCIFFPYTGKTAAFEVAERLRKKISECAISTETEEGITSVTVSIGVSEVEVNDSHHTDALKRADKTMYLAKNSGKNKTCI